MSRYLDAVRLVSAIWRHLLTVQWLLRRQPLSEIVSRLSRADGPPQRGRNAIDMGRAIGKSTAVGPFRPRCLPIALVHYRMLVEQGRRPLLVIGIPEAAENHDAHAWVELDGFDVGPPPGRQGRAVLARYGPNGPISPDRP